MSLYEGELLSGYYDNWVLEEQRTLADHFFQALVELTRCLVSAGEVEPAIRHAQHGLKMDPLREEAHYELVRLYAAAGQPTQALRQYRELENVLRRELDSVPSETFEDLVSEVEAVASPGASSASPVERPQRPLHPPPEASSLTSSEKPDLPVGTVSFLVTDKCVHPPSSKVEKDSGTGENFLPSLVRTHGGRVVSEEPTVAVFSGATEAVNCGIALAREATANLPERETGLRMAIDTGDVELEQDSYKNRPAACAVQILRAAQPGQIVCSQRTVLVLNKHHERTARFVDLGVFRLKDWPSLERLYQIEYAGMQARQFPPLKAEFGCSSNLPLQFTRFFGRRNEIDELQGLLEDPEVRLVTLTGLAGSGKTRLSVEVAKKFVEPLRGAVWFVPLADLTDAEHIPNAFQESLHLPRSPDMTPMDQVIQALNRQPALLVLDNFEHLVEKGAGVVLSLLQQVPALNCLVTSRHSLDLSGEHEFLLRPLPTPQGDETPQQLIGFDSVNLFVDRAQMMNPDFQITERNTSMVAEVCSRLEGIPLALELVAARAQVMSLRDILEGIGGRLDGFAKDRRLTTSRHPSLRAAIDWSFRLLPPDLQRFFSQLSVFRGGWTREAAEQVCNQPHALDYLTQLRRCSLLLVEPGGGRYDEIRFRMFETLREYAEDNADSRVRLDEAEHAPLAERHAAYFVCLAEEAESSLLGRHQLRWLDRLLAEDENLRAVLERSAASERFREQGFRLVGALWPFWYGTGRLTEGRDWLKRLSVTGGDVSAAARARAEAGGAVLALFQNDSESAVSHSLHGLALGEQAGDHAVVALSQNILGKVARERGDLETAMTLHQDSLTLCRKTNNPWHTALTLVGMSNVAIDRRNYKSAVEWCVESQELFEGLGDKWGIAAAVGTRGLALLHRRKFTEAKVLFKQSLSLFHEIGERRSAAEGLEALAAVSAGELKARDAIRLYAAAASVREELKTPQLPQDRKLFDKYMKLVRRLLGSKAFQAAWDAGQQLTLDQAVESVLGRERSP